MIIEISVAVIAAAFVLLVVYLIILIRSLRVTLSQIDHLSREINGKTESLTPFFNALNQTGQILEKKAANLKKDYDYCLEEEYDREECEKKNLIVATAAIELMGIGLSAWQKIKKRR